MFDRTDLIPLFQSLKAENQKVFLLTNSNHHYARALLNCAFKGESNWRTFFDLIVYRSRKPQIFFVPDTPFSVLENPELPGESSGLRPLNVGEKLQLGKEYYGGNIEQLKNDLLGEDEVIYVGDELFGDVVVPSCFVGWSTIAVVEELIDLEELNGYLIDSSHQTTREMKQLEKTAAKLNIQGWGNYFYTADGHLSYWGFLMHYFSDISVPCLQRLAHFDLNALLQPHHPEASNGESVQNSKLHPTTSHLDTNNHGLSSSFVLPDIHYYKTIQLSTDAVRFLARKFRHQILKN